MSVILDKDITVVVQGPIIGNTDTPNIVTKRCLESVRECMPDSFIILSTWENSDTKGLQYDELIESKDFKEGGIQLYSGKYVTIMNNVNRQICSTINGLRHVETKYSLKLRSDSIIRHKGFVKVFMEAFDEYDERYKFFESRIVTLNIRNAKRNSRPFFFNDWFQFGLTEDLVKLWDIQYDRITDKEVSLDINKRYFVHLLPEQFIWTSLVKKYMSLDFDSQKSTDKHLIKVSEATLVNNIQPVDNRQFGVWSQKHPKVSQKSLCYSELEWRKLYNSYCLNHTVKKQNFYVKGILTGIYKSVMAMGYYLKDKLMELNPEWYWQVRRKLFKQ